MSLTLHRSTLFAITFEKPGVDRAFAFELEIAIGAASDSSLGDSEGIGNTSANSVSENETSQRAIESVVDPDSGMLVNLVEVDAWLGSLKAFLKTCPLESVRDLVVASRDYLQTILSSENLKLAKVCFHEKRGEFYGWDGDFFFGRVEHLELLNSDLPSQNRSSLRAELLPSFPALCRIETIWDWPQRDEAKSLGSTREAKVPSLKERLAKSSTASVFSNDIFSSLPNLVEIEIEHFQSGLSWRLRK